MKKLETLIDQLLATTILAGGYSTTKKRGDEIVASAHGRLTTETPLTPRQVRDIRSAFGSGHSYDGCFPATRAFLELQPLSKKGITHSIAAEVVVTIYVLNFGTSDQPYPDEVNQSVVNARDTQDIAKAFQMGEVNGISFKGKEIDTTQEKLPVVSEPIPERAPGEDVDRDENGEIISYSEPEPVEAQGDQSTHDDPPVEDGSEDAGEDLLAPDDDLDAVPVEGSRTPDFLKNPTSPERAKMDELDARFASMVDTERALSEQSRAALKEGLNNAGDVNVLTITKGNQSYTCDGIAETGSLQIQYRPDRNTASTRSFLRFLTIYGKFEGSSDRFVEMIADDIARVIRPNMLKVKFSQKVSGVTFTATATRSTSMDD